MITILLASGWTIESNSISKTCFSMPKSEKFRASKYSAPTAISIKSKEFILNSYLYISCSALYKQNTQRYSDFDNILMRIKFSKKANNAIEITDQH